jgi:4-amino-4-deoxy-L-arabinose transferase-like glycosyltransferase
MTGPDSLAPSGRRASTRVRVAAMVAVFACALGVRLLYAANAFADLYGVEQERYRIAHFYHEAAAGLAEGDDRVVFPSDVAPGDTLLVGYPPGYFAFMAPLYALSGNRMEAVLLAQCVLDALTCLLLVLLGEALVSTAAGTVAGLLMALSPQFAYLSLVLKPDTLTVLPVLAALLLVVRAARAERLGEWVTAGVLLGVACWLRQNALLLAPALAVTTLALAWSRRNALGAALLVAACVAVVAPLTYRNLVLYGEPIPVTTGSGFALLSGLARDDYAGRYGLPRFAYNVSVEEARERGLHDAYYFDEYDRLQAGHRRKFETRHTVLSVFSVDGIARDRERRRQAIALVEADPVYFASIYWLRLRRLVGYTEQNRPVSQEVGPPRAAHESLAFYEALSPRWGAWRYYAAEGSVLDFARPPLAAMQRLFVTPLVLFAAVAGLAVLALRGWRRAALLLVMPVYYLGLQALMWAEFRHTLPVHASAFVFAGLAAEAAAAWLLVRLKSWRS